MDKLNLVRVFVKGGIISPGDFLKIIQTASHLGSSYIHFGSRQDILFPADTFDQDYLDKTFASIQTDYEINANQYQNIVTSYVSLDVMPRRSWLVPHIYHYILDSFDYRPGYKINIVDPSQSMVPLVSGQFNFIASGVENYWYLYLRSDEMGSKPWPAPSLIYGYDIAKVARALEDTRNENGDISFEALYQGATERVKINTQPVKEALAYPDVNFPYYEGFNRIPDGKYWLGLYWRNNQFDIKFLKALCQRCIETDIGKISLSPWKSFIIKGIEEKHRIGWEKLLGRYGINMRHSSLELNWHIPVLDGEAMELKSSLVREMDKMDISTYGLTFSIVSNKNVTLFTSVVIERNEAAEEVPTYNIQFSKDFNPNLMEYQYFVKDITKEIIPPLLLELSYMYYEQLDEKSNASKAEVKIDVSGSESHYQCKECLTIYDENLGDAVRGIAPGVAFNLLPETYTCPTCGVSKNAFRKVSLNI
jgi:rubredoxin